jgi:hypothetical protein
MICYIPVDFLGMHSEFSMQKIRLVEDYVVALTICVLCRGINLRYMGTIASMVSTRSDLEHILVSTCMCFRLSRFRKNWETYVKYFAVTVTMHCVWIKRTKMLGSHFNVTA